MTSSSQRVGDGKYLRLALSACRSSSVSDFSGIAIQYATSGRRSCEQIGPSFVPPLGTGNSPPREEGNRRAQAQYIAIKGHSSNASATTPQENLDQRRVLHCGPAASDRHRLCQTVPNVQDVHRYDRRNLAYCRRPPVVGQGRVHVQSRSSTVSADRGRSRTILGWGCIPSAQKRTRLSS